MNNLVAMTETQKTTINKLVGAKLSGVQVLDALNIDIEQWAKFGASPCMVLRENEANLADDFGACYGHIPKGLNGLWRNATALAVVAYGAGILQSFVDQSPEIVSKLAEVFSDSKRTVSAENIDSGFLLAVLLGRVPKHDNVLLWTTSGQTLPRFDEKRGVDSDSDTSAEKLQNQIIIELAEFCGINDASNNTASIRRGNLGQRIAFTRLSNDEIAKHETELAHQIEHGSFSDAVSASEQLLTIDSAKQRNAPLYRNPLTGKVTADNEFVISDSDIRGQAIFAQYTNAMDSGDAAKAAVFARQLNNHLAVQSANVAKPIRSTRKA